MLNIFFAHKNFGLICMYNWNSPNSIFIMSFPLACISFKVPLDWHFCHLFFLQQHLVTDRVLPGISQNMYFLIRPWFKASWTSFFFIFLQYFCHILWFVKVSTKTQNWVSGTRSITNKQQQGKAHKTRMKGKKF